MPNHWQKPFLCISFEISIESQFFSYTFPNKYDILRKIHGTQGTVSILRYSNLHTHSNFSDGAHSMEQIVRTAIDQNMVSLGFSDHSYTWFDLHSCMREEQYPLYRETIGLLQKKYGDQIRRFSGIERDFYSQVDTSVYDYVIGSVHYILQDGVYYAMDVLPEEQKRCIEVAFDGDVLAMSRRYYQLLEEHIRTNKPTFVGHFDLITKFGNVPEEDPAYVKIASEAMERILRINPYLEMNTGAISRGWKSLPYPGQYLLDTVKQCGGKILLSSDSHNKDTLLCYFDESVQILKNAGFDCIHVFNGTGFDPVEI